MAHCRRRRSRFARPLASRSLSTATDRRRRRSPWRLQAWQDIARGAGLIDAGGHWAGGKTILVQLGDITDREPDSLKIVRNLQQLQKEAPRKGGKVVVVLGNHEAMNLLGDNRYTTAGEYAAFADSQSPARRDRVYAANKAPLEAAVRRKTRKSRRDQIRAAWMAEHPLGWVEHARLGTIGRSRQMGDRNPAIVKIGGTLSPMAGSAPNMRARRSML